MQAPHDHSKAPSLLLLGGGALGVYALGVCLSRGLDIRAVVLRRSESDGGSDMESRSRAGGIPTISSATRPWSEVQPLVAEHTTDYLLSVQYDRIIPPEILRPVKRASLNFHFSPLPRLRGCFPTKWAIINGEKSGVTVHHIDNGIDTGPIVFQSIVEVEGSETDANLYSRLIEVGKDLVDEVVDAVCVGAVPGGTDQDDAAASYHPMGLPGSGIVDWSQPVEQVARFIRAHTFPPYPGAIVDEGQRGDCQVRAPVRRVAAKGLTTPGEYRFDETGLVVRCGDDAISVGEVLWGDEVVTAEVLESRLGGSGRFGRRDETD